MLLWWSIALANPLAARHDPGCEAVVDVPTAELIAWVDEELPPWLPLRAAVCVTRRAVDDEAAWRAARNWVSDGDRPGLGLAVVSAADSLPEERAVELADRLVDATDNDARIGRFAVRALERSGHPAVRQRAVGLRTAVESVR